jgi:hypothetical protein
MLKKLATSACCLLIAMASTSALAQTAQFQGHIKNVMTSGPYNFAFRVTLDTDMAGCGDNFAYMNLDDANYQAKAAQLLTAYALRNTVNLSITYVQVGTVQRCVLGDIVACVW